jgi:transposase
MRKQRADAMEKRSYRRFTAEEKRTILEETRQPGVTLSEVCRKHSVSPALVYQWRAVAQQATTAALQQVDSRGKSQPDAQTARLLAELERMRRVVAEITAENLELKKNSRAARKSPFERTAETGSAGGGRADAATERVASGTDSGVFGSAT